MRIKNNNSNFLYGIASLVIVIVCFKIPDACVFAGVDGSFRWAFNELMAHKRTLLTGLYYPCGPFLFLRYPISYGDHLIISHFVELAIRLMLCYYVLQVVQLFNSKRIIPIAIGCCFIVQCALYFDYLIAVTLLLHYILYLFRPRWWELFIGQLLFVVTLYIKTGISLPSIALYSMFFLLLLVQKRWKHFLQNVIFTIAIAVISSFFVYGSIISIFIQVYKDLWMSINYSNESVLYVVNNYALLFFSPVFLLVIPFLSKEKNIKIVFALVSFYLIVMWKYCIGRQDESHNFSWLYAIAVIAIPLWIVAKNKLLIATCILFSFSFFAINTKSIFGKVDILPKAPNFQNFVLLFFNTAFFKKDRMDVSIAETKRFVLPPAMLSNIKNSTIDFFPFELSIGFANNLNYLPRPCLQLNAFGTKGDKLDAAFYESANKPKFLLWHNSFNGQFINDGLDNKLLQNDCASTLMAIEKNYELSMVDTPNYYLFKKRDTALQQSVVPLMQQNISFNIKAFLPNEIQNSKEQIVLKANIHFNEVYHLRKLVYKGIPFQMVYYLEDGTNYEYTISKESLATGIVINKLFIDPMFHFKKVVAYQLKCNNMNFVKSICNSQYFEISFTK